jgi:4-hydroxybenzoate polyprenyltransferase
LSIPLLIIYPLLKRFTYFPQAFLGFTFNFGILVSSIDMKGEITLASLVLYLGAVFWTMGYDSIYGFMDIKDDKKIGIKSLAILIQKCKPKIWLLTFYIIFVLFTCCSAYLEGKSLNRQMVFMIILILAQFMWQVFSVDLTNPNDCSKKFKSNILAGLLVFLFLSL